MSLRGLDELQKGYLLVVVGDYALVLKGHRGVNGWSLKYLWPGIYVAIEVGNT